MFRKEYLFGVLLFFTSIGFCIYCPDKCILNENNETCICTSNLNSWTPIYDFILTNVSVQNNSENTSIVYSFENPYHYIGNISVCLYYKDTLLDQQIVQVLSDQEISNFTILGCLSEPQVKIDINCDKNVNEINYTNNVEEVYNETLKCSEEGWDGEGGASAEVPENTFYVIIVFLIMLYHLHSRSNDKD